MFEKDLDALPPRDLLEAAAECRVVASRADARVLECAQVYADRFHPMVCGVRPGRRSCGGREQAVILGGEGCPPVAEFAIAEFALVLGVSPGVGRLILGDALALRHRFPKMWARVQAGEATPWKARQIVRSCAKLSHAAAEDVDRRVAAIVDTISPYRLDKIVAAAKKHADPGLAADEAAEAADERGVFVGRGDGDGHGSKTIYIKAAAAAVNRCDATIAAIAEALQTFGDTRPLQRRRAEAIDILADPRFTQELLTQAQSNNTPPHPTNTTPPPANTSTPPAPANGTPPLENTSSMSRLRNGPANGSTTGLSRPANDTSSHGDTSSGSRPANSTPLQGNTSSSPRESSSNSPELTGLPDRSEPHGLLEPIGPWEDPWLEAVGPCDPDSATDPFDSRPVHDAPDSQTDADEARPMDAAALRALDARLAQIKHDAYTNPIHLGPSTTDPPSLPSTNHPPSPPGSPSATDPARPDSQPSSAGPASLDNPAGSTSPTGRVKGQVRPAGAREVRVRPGQTEVIVHLTDHTLATGTGVLRAETIGPLLATQLTELIGHGPYTVKPVIDLNDAISVNAYEIPTRIRDRIKLTHPVELFPYGTRETTNTIDLDHIEPYDPHGPTGQTSTTNLAPLGRFGHRVKTHAHGWTVHRIDYKTLEWTTPHGFTFHVDPNGTHRVRRNVSGRPPAPEDAVGFPS